MDAIFCRHASPHTRSRRPGIRHHSSHARYPTCPAWASATASSARFLHRRHRPHRYPPSTSFPSTSFGRGYLATRTPLQCRHRNHDGSFTPGSAYIGARLGESSRTRSPEATIRRMWRRTVVRSTGTISPARVHTCLTVSGSAPSSTSRIAHICLDERKCTIERNTIAEGPEPFSTGLSTTFQHPVHNFPAAQGAKDARTAYPPDRRPGKTCTTPLDKPPRPRPLLSNRCRNLPTRFPPNSQNPRWIAPNSWSHPTSHISQNGSHPAAHPRARDPPPYRNGDDRVPGAGWCPPLEGAPGMIERWPMTTRGPNPRRCNCASRLIWALAGCSVGEWAHGPAMRRGGG